ncbi:MAG TPA: nitroreductase [Mycobacteriales bacterium]|nr:nitroreductase [Mycobacteriales bacterium]
MDEGAFLSIITARHCKRAFLDQPVPTEVLARVLRAAGQAPSTRNTQFWQVAVLLGAARDGLSDRLCAQFDAGIPRRPDYVNRPPNLGEVYQHRSTEWGAGLYGAKGVARDDEAGRRAHDRENFQFYGAPVVMIFHLPSDAVPGTFLEMGFFLQNVMLGLVSCGLGSCPQYSVAGYAEDIRQYCGLGSDRLVVCGMSVGYVDESAPVNAFHPPRANLDSYTRWHSHGPSVPDNV